MEENETYENEVNSNKHDNIKIKIKKIENNLEIQIFIENFIKKTYIGNFSLDDLKNKSNYFNQFNDTKMISLTILFIILFIICDYIVINRMIFDYDSIVDIRPFL